ncbi:MAG: ABC-F family ATP-binding cassette domain-containing protein, partial [Bdellovibrionales bacterium]|nr:ABC-F family ATP-binding cassette domain-containing protein [Bdellovibrionales bacterium]
LSLLITPKTRLSLLGHNGCGKSTLIKILLGLENPDSGSVFIGSTKSSHASDIKVSYFEQSRDTLDLKKSVFRNICADGDFVSYRGQPMHARSYLDRFLFSGQKVDLPVSKLSGGEQARLRIAQLMLKEAQVLVLDEPTNDLDSDTLDVLEDALSEFNGAVILVTHDRYFMDAVSNQILAFPPEDFEDRSLQKFSSYLQWEDWYENETNKKSSSTTSTTKASGANNSANNDKSSEANLKKLSFSEKLELENIETTIQKIESELGFATEKNDYNKMAQLQKDLEETYARWESLSKRPT